MHRRIVLILVASLPSASWAGIAIPTVPIGNAGNAPDSSSGDLYGSVAYEYNIGATEVTNAQYAAFLNCVAATDSNNLYNSGMAGVNGGITQSGSAGSYTYATINGRANNPVNFVTFWDAARFTNWLHNGQPTGPQSGSTTEDGAYTLTPEGIASNTIARNSGWQWALASENEWYKAAYYQPHALGGDDDDYWQYPTSSNSISLAFANYGSLVGDTTPAGSYAANFYGLFDMGGNVSEWNEAIIGTSFRGLRGGSFGYPAGYLRADNRNHFNPSNGYELIGIRVVQVPAPSSAALLALAGLGMDRRRRESRNRPSHLH